jgi:hypothetical protein
MQVKDLIVTGDAKIIGNLKSNHTHDDRYYTETEVNNLLASKVSCSTPLTFSVTADGIL